MKRRFFVAALALTTACGVATPAGAAETTTAAQETTVATTTATPPAEETNPTTEPDSKSTATPTPNPDASSTSSQEDPAQESSTGSSRSEMSEERKKVCQPLFEKASAEQKLTDEEKDELRSCRDELLPAWARLTPEADLAFAIINGIIAVAYALSVAGVAAVQASPQILQTVRNFLGSLGVRI